MPALMRDCAVPLRRTRGDRHRLSFNIRGHSALRYSRGKSLCRVGLLPGAVNEGYACDWCGISPRNYHQHRRTPRHFRSRGGNDGEGS